MDIDPQTVTATATEPPPHAITAHHDGDPTALFGLALRTGLLTLATLGLYRFWAKTRVRAYIWSCTDIAGARFEYTGTGLEKFLGFLVAVVLLAAYLGLVQMGLFFFGIALLRPAESEAEAVAQAVGASVTGAAILPFLYFAIYRARRYKLARTRWRGIRFGMETGAWGYAFRALGYGALTLGSLGLLLPLATFRLEQYMTDRSWFGDARFIQQGRWQDLYAPMTHMFVALGILAAGLLLTVTGLVIAAPLAIVLSVTWLIFGYVHYSVQSFAYLTSHKRLRPDVMPDAAPDAAPDFAPEDAADITFASAPRTGTVIRTYLLGSLAVGLVAAIAFGMLGSMTGAGALMDPETLGGGPALRALVLGAVGYLVILVGAGAGALALITQPILQHYVTTLAVTNLAAIDAITQRAADQGADAEGFADALDIGGAI